MVINKRKITRVAEPAMAAVAAASLLAACSTGASVKALTEKRSGAEANPIAAAVTSTTVAQTTLVAPVTATLPPTTAAPATTSTTLKAAVRATTTTTVAVATATLTLLPGNQYTDFGTYVSVKNSNSPSFRYMNIFLNPDGSTLFTGGAVDTQPTETSYWKYSKLKMAPGETYTGLVKVYDPNGNLIATTGTVKIVVPANDSSDSTTSTTSSSTTSTTMQEGSGSTTTTVPKQ